jgi:hypothetical protein
MNIRIFSVSIVLAGAYLGYETFATPNPLTNASASNPALVPLAQPLSISAQTPRPKSPTKTPKPTKSPKPTKTPKPTPTPKPTRTKYSHDNHTVYMPAPRRLDVNDLETQIAFLHMFMSTGTPEATETPTSMPDILFSPTATSTPTP